MDAFRKGSHLIMIHLFLSCTIMFSCRCERRFHCADYRCHFYCAKCIVRKCRGSCVKMDFIVQSVEESCLKVRISIDYASDFRNKTSFNNEKHRPCTTLVI